MVIVGHTYGGNYIYVKQVNVKLFKSYEKMRICDCPPTSQSHYSLINSLTFVVFSFSHKTVSLSVLFSLLFKEWIYFYFFINNSYFDANLGVID